eukprot:scaffold95593_cov75-Phaeocystis_antarctica.AAC.2
MRTRVRGGRPRLHELEVDEGEDGEEGRHAQLVAHDLGCRVEHLILLDELRLVDEGEVPHQQLRHQNPEDNERRDPLSVHRRTLDRADNDLTEAGKDATLEACGRHRELFGFEASAVDGEGRLLLGICLVLLRHRLLTLRNLLRLDLLLGVVIHRNPLGAGARAPAVVQAQACRALSLPGGRAPGGSGRGGCSRHRLSRTRRRRFESARKNDQGG